MNNHPLNLLLRFLLELCLLAITTWWGWQKFSGGYRYLMAIALPLLLAAAWAIFRVEGESGKAPVAIAGWARLLFEICLFTAATVFLFSLGREKLAYVFIAVVLLHYLFSYDRMVWLLQQK